MVTQVAALFWNGNFVVYPVHLRIYRLPEMTAYGHVKRIILCVVLFLVIESKIERRTEH